MYPAGENCCCFGIAVILFIIRYCVCVCVYQFTQLEKYKAFPINSCLFIALYDAFSERKCLEQNNRCKIRFHAVVWSYIPNDMIQKTKVLCLFFGGQVYKHTSRLWLLGSILKLYSNKAPSFSFVVLVFHRNIWRDTVLYFPLPFYSFYKYWNHTFALVNSRLHFIACVSWNTECTYFDREGVIISFSRAVLLLFMCPMYLLACSILPAELGAEEVLVGQYVVLEICFKILLNF